MLKIFKIIALLEGVSFIIMMLIGMPLKYIGGNDIIIKYLGMPHGLLFVTYVVFAFLLQGDMKWNTKDMAIILLGSLIPFGTFYVDKKYLS
jgi:integral membrane protein